MNEYVLTDSAFRSKVNDCIEKYINASDGIKLSVGIYHRGEKYVFGNGNDVATRKYDIGSVSKTLCAHLILELEEKGLLDVSKTVDEYLPLKRGKYPTLYELLTHTAGYWHLTPLEITLPRLAFHRYAKYNVYENCTDKTVIDCLERRCRHRAGRKYGYSDFPYAILAVVAERVTKTPFSTLFFDFIQNRIGMRDTELCTEQSRGVNAILGKKQIDLWRWSKDNPYIAGGGIASPLSDMLKYIELQSVSDEGFITRAHTLCKESLSKKSKEAMCIGWHTYKRSNQLWHVGGVGTFRTSVIVNRKRDIGVVVMGNSKGKASANVHYLAKMLYSELKANKIRLEQKEKI